MSNESVALTLVALTFYKKNHSFNVWSHLAKQLQKRNFFKIFAIGFNVKTILRFRRQDHQI